MSEKRAELLLACVIIARSTSFVFNKLGLGTMTAFNLLAVRFLLAFVLLALLFWKRLRHISRRTVGRGALLGGLFFVVMSCEMFALKRWTPARCPCWRIWPSCSSRCWRARCGAPRPSP